MYSKFLLVLSVVITTMFFFTPQAIGQHHQCNYCPQGKSVGDWNGDYSVNTMDILEFFFALNSQCPYADITREGDWAYINGSWVYQNGVWDAQDTSRMNKIVNGPRLPELGHVEVYIPADGNLTKELHLNPADIINGFVADSYNFIMPHEVFEYDPSYLANNPVSCPDCEQSVPAEPWNEFPGVAYSVHEPFDTAPAVMMTVTISDSRSDYSYAHIAGNYLTPLPGTDAEQFIDSLGYDGLINQDLIYYFFETPSDLPPEFDFDQSPLTTDYEYFEAFIFLSNPDPFYFVESSLIAWNPTLLPDSDGDGRIEMTGPSLQQGGLVPWNPGSDFNPGLARMSPSLADSITQFPGIDANPNQHPWNPNLEDFCREFYGDCLDSLDGFNVPGYDYEPPAPPPSYFPSRWTPMSMYENPDRFEGIDRKAMWLFLIDMLAEESCYIDCLDFGVTLTPIDPESLSLIDPLDCIPNKFGGHVEGTRRSWSIFNYIETPTGKCFYCGCAIE